jgi:hypothetical protein
MLFLAGLLSLLCLAPVVRAQDADPILVDDIRFADNLARYRYYDLAFDLIGQLRSGKLSPEEKGTLDYTEARINRQASEATADPERQLKYQSAAIELLRDWAKAGTPYVYHPSRPAALKELADVLQARGRLRARQMKAAEAASVEAMRALADTDFKDSDEVRGKLKGEYDDLAGQATDQGNLDIAERHRASATLTIYERGLNAVDWAEVSKDRDYGLDQAFQLLGDFQWELEEEVLSQHFAVHYQGVVRHKQGKLQEALDLQKEVLEKGAWYWENVLGDPKAAPFVAELFDRTWGELASVQAEMGDADAADAVITGMLEAHGKMKLPYGGPGFDVLLGWAEQLEALGRSGKALDIVKLVADQGASLPQGEIARSRLATIVTEAGISDASPSVLMAAAKGLNDRKEYAESAFQYTRVAGSLRNDAERSEYLVPAWLGAGRAFASDKRTLEAALAFEQALDAAIALKAAPEVQETAAAGMSRHFDRRFVETNDPFDRALRDQVRERLTKLGIVADVAWSAAKEAFDNANALAPPDPAAFMAAYQELQSVTEDAPSFELSLVYQGRALAGAGKAEEAIAAFDVLINRAADPAFAPPNAAARGRREVALGSALYYKAEVLLSDAVARPADALAALAGFEDKLSSQAGLVESVKFQRIIAHAMLGDVDSATKAVEDLKAFKADSSYLRVGWFRLSDALLKASEAARAKGDAAAADMLLARAADAMWNSAELGGFPSYNNLLSTGGWYTRVGKPELAQRSFLKALEVFGREGSGVTPEQLDEARIGLAQSYNQALEFGRARPYWKDLETRRPNDTRVLVGAARGYGGWLQLAPDGSVQEIPGSGDYNDALLLWVKLFKNAQANAQYESIWWESKLGTIYTQYRGGAALPQSLIDARRNFDNLTVLNPNYDEETIGSLPEEKRYAPLWKPLFKYLEKKIPRR